MCTRANSCEDGHRLNTEGRRDSASGLVCGDSYFSEIPQVRTMHDKPGLCSDLAYS